MFALTPKLMYFIDYFDKNHKIKVDAKSGSVLYVLNGVPRSSNDNGGKLVSSIGKITSVLYSTVPYQNDF